jgi:two-component system alkaline phosphatase synthesis response regulator PhoP
MSEIQITQGSLMMSRVPAKRSYKIVVVEDEADIADVIVYNLEREGFEVMSSDRGDEGLNLIRRELPDLVILDLMLPGFDGLSACQQLKADAMTRDIPIIIVSAKVEDSDIVIGLGLGADDYIPKPFNTRELVARVKVALRKIQPSRVQADDARLVFDELVVDSDRHEVTVSGNYLKLTVTEFRLLQQLAANPGRAFTREQLISRALGEGVAIVDRNIDVHIVSLRRKLGSASNMIETIRGIGYRFSPD